MKNFIYKLIIVCILSIPNLISAQCVAGTININTSPCASGMISLYLSGHSSTQITAYSWQVSNDNGVSWVVCNIFNNSGNANSNTDNQLVSSTAPRMYRCYVTCASGSSYSDTLFPFYNIRSLSVNKKFCSLTAGGNDSILIKSKTIGLQTDQKFAKNYLWQISSTAGAYWSNLPNNSDSIKVKFTSNNLLYRAFVSICPITNILPDTPSSQVIPAITVGLSNISLAISNRDCVNDTATLSLSSSAVHSSLTNLFTYQWFGSTNYSGTYTKSINTLKNYNVKVDDTNRFYYSALKLCNNPFSSIDSAKTDIYSIYVKQGTFAATYDCTTEEAVVDYQYRDSLRKSVYTYWMKSLNDTIYQQSFAPNDTFKYSFPLTNHQILFYKIYTKFCPSSTRILDSSVKVNVRLSVSAGDLQIDTAACPSDSIYLSLNNFAASSNFTVYSEWQWKNKYMGMSTYETYYGTSSKVYTATNTNLRMPVGLTEFRKATSLCPGKYAKSIYSTVASSFLPYQLIDSIDCTSSTFVLKVKDDTIKLKDYRYTQTRKGPFAYQWLRSTNNKVTSNVMPGRVQDTLQIGQADKNNSFKRIIRICPATTFQDTSAWNTQIIKKPDTLRGKAQILTEVCLYSIVPIGIVDITHPAGQSPTYLWQSSNDELKWSNIIEPTANDSVLFTQVTNVVKFYRRLTLWCPSGIVDSSLSVPVIYKQPLPWCEDFANQSQTGSNILFNCWTRFSPVCSSYTPFNNQPFFSNGGKGRTGIGYTNQKPTPPPTNQRNDIKWVTPAFFLERGKIYRLSFWHMENASNLCWDSLYVTYGTSLNDCALNTKFGDVLTNFSFDQFGKYWADFVPQDSSIYYFAINVRDNNSTTGEIQFDDVCLKEVKRCDAKNITIIKGNIDAPQKKNDRVEDPYRTVKTYDKDKVQQQYCIGDTIMLTYSDQNYATNFDYYGMSYQFYKKREDADWNMTDTFYKPIPSQYIDGSFGFNKPLNYNCHITNRTSYHIMNALATDTNTWYKIVATCDLNGKQYHTDSVLINGTHSVPYCDDWEGVGRLNGNGKNFTNPLCNGASNASPIEGKVPAFSPCPTCWASFPQATTGVPLYSITLPIMWTCVPNLEPNTGYQGNDVVMNAAEGYNSPIANANSEYRKKVLVFPAVRLYKGRGYRVSFRWADNRKKTQSPHGELNQDLDSLYLTVSKRVPSGMTMDSFSRAKMVPGGLRKDLQSNILEVAGFKYRTYWQDYTPNDTGTYYFGIAVVKGNNPGFLSAQDPYRFLMDYFCIDTLPMDDCNERPEFIDPLRIRISPDAKSWYPGNPVAGCTGTQWSPPGENWCVGEKINIDLDFGQGPKNSWKYGYKMYWQKNTVRCPGVPVWKTVDSGNSIDYTLTYKFQDYRLVLTNKCGTKADTVGPFGVTDAGGDLPWREGFDRFNTYPPCWVAYGNPNIEPYTRVNVFNADRTPVRFDDGCTPNSNYLDIDFETRPNPLLGTPALSQQITVVPPGFGLSPGVKYRFSFWFKGNHLGQSLDSIKAGWTYQRSTDQILAAPNGSWMVNRVNNDFVKNHKSKEWTYYTTEFTAAKDTAHHFKVTAYNTADKRNYRLRYENFNMKQMLDTDLIVIAIDSPRYECDLTKNTSVRVKVMNIGNKTLSNIPIKVQTYSTAGPIASGVLAGPLATNQIGTVVISGVDLSTPAYNAIWAWTDLPTEQDRSDDTFQNCIMHNDLFPAPTDTIDSVCICTNAIHVDPTPNNQSRWYRKLADVKPFYVGDTMRVDNLCFDSVLYRSAWNGGECFTFPRSFSSTAPSYSAAQGALTFENISKDTLLLETCMIFAQTTSPVPIKITINQFGPTGPATGTQIASTFVGIPKIGRQTITLNLKIPPGTDYRIWYPGGAATLALSPNYIFFGDGCPTMGINIYGDQNWPGTVTNYNYFYNWKLIKPGCETEKVKFTFHPVDKPIVKIKDTNRVCQEPVYQVCGPDAINGHTYTYKWNSGGTNKCDPALITKWYVLTVTNEFGCKGYDSLNLIVDPSPKPKLGNDTFFCKYSPHILDSKLDSNSHVVAWTGGLSGAKVSILNPGTYIATAYNTVNFCAGADTIVVTRRELPVFSLGNDRVFCGAPANVGILLPTSGLTYSWPLGGPVITALGKKKYIVFGTDNTTKCVNTDTIEANIVAAPAFDLGPDVSICGANTTLNGPVGNYTYKWNTTATSRSILVSTPGTYYLTVTDAQFDCKTVDSIKVSFKAIPTFDLGPNVTKCALMHAIIAPTIAGASYSWKRPGDVFKSGTNIHSADISGTYYLTIDNGCYTFTDSIIIKLKTPPLLAIDMLKDTAGCNQVAIRASSWNNYTKIQWGTPLTDTANLILVKKTGTYTVTLTNECGTAAKSAFIRVDSMPVADFSPVYPNPDCMSIGLNNMSKNAIKYVWHFGDGSQDDTTDNPIHHYTAEGNYIVTLKAYNACGFATKSVQLIKRAHNCPGVGINTTTLDKAELQLFPNPTKTSTQLIGAGLPNGSYSVEIRNITGQVVYNNSKKVVDNLIDMTLDVSMYASGEYLVTITNDKETITRKLQILK